jgi:glycerol-3-phosphate dehydrogenase
MRPAWLLRLGLFLYDHLGGRKILPGTRVLDLKTDPAGRPLKEQFSKAFEYSDCWVNDARLVVLNAMDAKARGADIFTRTRLVSARRSGDGWDIELQPDGGKATRQVRARLIVNAGGPWVDDILRESIGQNKARQRASRPGKPYRHPAQVRASQGLFLPELGRADFLRHPL